VIRDPVAEVGAPYAVDVSVIADAWAATAIDAASTTTAQSMPILHRMNRFPPCGPDPGRRASLSTIHPKGKFARGQCVE